MLTGPEPSHASYDPSFFAPLFAIEERHFWFRARSSIICAAAVQLMKGTPSGSRILEVGCGTGVVLSALEKEFGAKRVVGMDLFHEGLTFARNRVHCPLVQGDVLAAPFREPFAVVGLFDVLEHLSDDGRVLRDVRGLIAPGGALMITVPACMSLWSYFDDASHHCRRYELPELQSRLEEAGFIVEYISHFMAALYPLMWLGRRVAGLRRGRRTSEQLAESELRIVPVLNSLLSAILRREVRAIERRRRIPRGTSLLAVARPRG
jgi:SAM-dependent methyltransferase